jgi:hypothetical protein
MGKHLFKKTIGVTKKALFFAPKTQMGVRVFFESGTPDIGPAPKTGRARNSTV